MTSNLRGVGLFLVASICLLSSGSVGAATKAVIHLEYTTEYIQGVTVNQTGIGVATVGSTSSTPSVMWPKSIIYSFMSTIVGGTFYNVTSYITDPENPNTFSDTRRGTVFNQAGHLRKSNGPTGKRVFTPDVLNNVDTIHCTGFTTNVTLYPMGTCKPHRGTMSIEPLNPARRYGGTSKLLGNSSSDAVFLFGGSFVDIYFTLLDWSVNGTDIYAHNATIPFDYDVDPGYIYVFPVLFPTFGFKYQQHVILMPATTGRAFAKNTGTDPSTYSENGSFALNKTNLTGTISVVQPSIQNAFPRALNGQVTGDSVFNLGQVLRTTITFLPEPLQLSMLCAGTGLIVIAALSRRR